MSESLEALQKENDELRKQLQLKDEEILQLISMLYADK